MVRGTIHSYKQEKDKTITKVHNKILEGKKRIMNAVVPYSSALSTIFNSSY
jgi:hypothetical protein